VNAAAAGQARALARALLLPAVHHRVLLVLCLLALPAALGLAFVSVAPNRLVSGAGVPLFELMSPARYALGAPTALLVLAVFLPATRAVHGAVAVAAACLLGGLCWLAGDEAARQSATLSSLARVSLGGGFWALALLVWLAAAHAVQRLTLRPGWHVAVHALVLLPAALLLALGGLDELSLLKEYANRREVFDAALLRHVQIVLAALLPALAIGVPLGVAAARSTALAGPLLAVLNIIQTVPSIAVFALLIAPVGVGLAPAAIALSLYALLPVVHGVMAGLTQVPAAAVEAAHGMGMTDRQVFWRVCVPLALPVLLSGLRVTTVQIIGLAVVAALIGAGGFGALVFQGLGSSALDLVLLGVLPVVALAVLADAALGLLVVAARGVRVD
jgi:osmoprotectant transport system permease protein